MPRMPAHEMAELSQRLEQSQRLELSQRLDQSQWLKLSQRLEQSQRFEQSQRAETSDLLETGGWHETSRRVDASSLRWSPRSGSDGGLSSLRDARGWQSESSQRTWIRTRFDPSAS